MFFKKKFQATLKMQCKSCSASIGIEKNSKVVEMINEVGRKIQEQ